MPRPGTPIPKEMPQASFPNEIEAMKTPPDHETPRCAMPKTTNQHGHHQVRLGPYGALAITPQGNVQIVAQPTRQGNMPALPKIGETYSSIGKMEVVVEHEAKAQRDPNGAGGIAREVEVDLAGESE